MSKKFLLVLCVLAVTVPTQIGRADDPDKIRPLMQKKLEHSQKVLEGIAMNDFKMISKNAGDLIDISKQVEWKVLKTPQYEMYSNSFRRAAESMMQEAKAKNIDGVALNYVDLTLTCVKCHKHVREVRSARLD